MTNSGKGLPGDPKEYQARVRAAKLGCGVCGAALHRRESPAGDPFSTGGYKGRYWCSDCWTLWYDEHPEHLADDESRQYIAKEAERIRSDRQKQV